jgi:hypothetical protein
LVEKVKSQIAAAGLLAHGHQVGQESGKLADELDVLIYKLVLQKVAQLYEAKIDERIKLNQYGGKKRNRICLRRCPEYFREGGGSLKTKRGADRGPKPELQFQSRVGCLG